MLSNINYAVLFDVLNQFDRRSLGLQITRQEMEGALKNRSDFNLDRNSIFNEVNNTVRSLLPLRHGRLINSFLRKNYVHNSSLDREDIRSYGMLGLVEAASQFDISKDRPFGAYARFLVQRRILESFGQYFHGIRFPTWFQRKCRKISKRSHERCPLTEYEIWFMRSFGYRLFNGRTISLNSIPDTRNSPGECFIPRFGPELRHSLYRLIQFFPQSERDVIKGLYGICQKSVDPDALACRMGINMDQVYRIHDQALNRLRKKISARGLTWDQCFERAS